MYEFFFIEKALSLVSFWLLKSPELRSFKSMEMSSLLFCAQNDLNDVSSSGNLNSQKDHEDEVFL